MRAALPQHKQSLLQTAQPGSRQHSEPTGSCEAWLQPPSNLPRWNASCIVVLARGPHLRHFPPQRGQHAAGHDLHNNRQPAGVDAPVGTPPRALQGAAARAGRRPRQPSACGQRVAMCPKPYMPLLSTLPTTAPSYVGSGLWAVGLATRGGSAAATHIHDVAAARVERGGRRGLLPRRGSRGRSSGNQAVVVSLVGHQVPDVEHTLSRQTTDASGRPTHITGREPPDQLGGRAGRAARAGSTACAAQAACGGAGLAQLAGPAGGATARAVGPGTRCTPSF